MLRGLAATASAGYERISFPALGSSLVSIWGPIWNAGFVYTPDPRFSFTATYGRRYNAPDYEISAVYNGALTKATLTYSTAIETASMLLLSNLGQLGFSNGLPINIGTGLPFTGNAGFGNIPGLPFSATDSAFFLKFLNASVQTTRDRNTFIIYASYGTEHISAPTITETFFAASFDWGRNLQPRLTSHVSATYNRGNSGFSGEHQRVYSVLGSLAYTLSARSTASFSFAISDEQSNIPSNRIRDDIVSVSYRRQF